MGKGGGAVKGYKYYFALHMGICRGPVDALRQIQVGGKPVWPISWKALVSGGTNQGQEEDGTFQAGWAPEIYEENSAPPPQTASGLIQIHAGDIFGGKDGEGGIEGDCWVLMGEASQTPPSSLVAMLGGLVSGFRGVTTLFYDGLISMNNPYPKQWKIRVSRALKGWMDDSPFYSDKAIIYLESSFAGVDEGGDPIVRGIWAMNPAHIIYECLTNDEWGRGFPAESLDLASFTYAAQKLCCEGFGLCLKWSREDDIKSFIQVVMDHIGAVLYPSRETGLLVLTLVRDDYVFATLPLFTLQTGLLTIEEDDGGTSDGLVNEVVVGYVDPITGDNKQSRVHNVGGMQASGAIFSKSVDYPGLPTHELASRVAQRDLRIFGTALRRLKLTFDRRAWQIAPGRVFKISAPTRNIGTMVLRAGQVIDGDQGGSNITVTAVQDIFSLPATSFIGAVLPTPPVSQNPVVATRQRIVEASYIDTLRQISSAEFATLGEEETFIFLMAGRPSAFAIDFIPYTGYKNATQIARSFGTWAPTAIMPIMTALDQSYTATSITEPDRIVNGDVGLIDDEVVQIVSFDKTTGQFVLLRGCADTIPQTHADGAIFYVYYRGFGKDSTKYSESVNVTGRVLTHTLQGTLDPGLADELEIDTINRRIRPYPPGQFTVNGASFPSASVTQVPVTLAWVHRNRVLQADSILSHTAAGVTPEAGLTYVARAFSAGVEVRRFEGITGTSWTYTKAMWVADGSPTALTLQLTSKLGGYESWQKYSVDASIAAIPGHGWGSAWGTNWGSPVPPTIGSSLNIGMYQTASGVRAGNRQVIFYRFGGTPSNGNWNPPTPQTFHCYIIKVGPVLSGPADYTILAGYTLYPYQANPVQTVNHQIGFASGSGDSGINALATAAGMDVRVAARGVGGPYPSDWCEDFDSYTGLGYDYAIVFPVGERAWYSTYGAEPGGPAKEREYQASFFAIPDYPMPPTTVIDFREGKNFLDKVTVPRGQKVAVGMSQGGTVAGNTYRVTLGGVNFDYVAVVGDVNSNVVSSLSALIDANPNYTAVYTSVDNAIRIEGAPNVPYTFSVN